MTYFYQAEKFAAARRALMLPHTNGEAASVADAFHECSLGLHRIDRNGLSDDAKGWVTRLEAFMETTAVQDPNGRGAWLVKAEKFTTDDLIDISRLVDELAWWFDDHDRDH